MADDTRLPKLETLLTAAAKTFAERGYGGTSMRDIAQDSGISLSGIYYYTKGKAALLYDIQARAIDALMTSAKSATAGGSSADDQLLRFIESHMAYMRENASFVRVLSHESADGEADKRMVVETKRKEYIQMLRDIISRVIGGSSNSQIPLEFAADMAFAMMSGPNQWGSAGNNASQQRAGGSGLGPSGSPLSSNLNTISGAGVISSTPVGGASGGISGGNAYNSGSSSGGLNSSTGSGSSNSAGSAGSYGSSMSSGSSGGGSSMSSGSSNSGGAGSATSLAEQSKLIYTLLIGGLKGRTN